jgi:parallel beta-helix repeat protein
MKKRTFMVTLTISFLILGGIGLLGVNAPWKITSIGTITDLTVRLDSSPNPSHSNEPVTVYGNLTTKLISPSHQQVLIQYSTDSLNWLDLQEVMTNDLGSFSLETIPLYKGVIYFRATFQLGRAIIEHEVGDIIVASDGSGDYSDVCNAIESISPNGGVVCLKKGDYMMSRLVNLSNVSNLSLIGTGYETRIIKTEGITLKIANASRLFIENLHFHHLKNDACTSIRVEGLNKDIFIRRDWFTREDGPPGSDTDTIYFDPTSLTDNLHIESCSFEKAQVDAIALKGVINSTIQNNTIVDAATEYDQTASGITVEKCSNLTINKNVLARRGLQDMAGISVFGNSQTIYISENEMTNMDSLGINLYNSTGIYVAVNHVINTHNIALRAEDVLATSIQRNNFETTQKTGLTATAIFVTSSENTTIDGNLIRETETGIVVVDSKTIVIENCNIYCASQQTIVEKNGILVNNCSKVKVTNNTVMNASYFGLEVSMSPGIVIDMNILQDNRLSGIKIWESNYSTVSRNTAKNNGQSNEALYDTYGIDLSDSFSCTIDGNKAFDDQLTKTQRYGFVEKGRSDYNTVTNNDFRYNAVESMRIIGIHTVAYDNVG